MSIAIPAKSGIKMAIISPHLDDAVLSCFNHMQTLISGGIELTVVNIFTRYGEQSVIPTYSELFMKTIGCDSVQQYEQIRKNEDLQALAVLGVKSVCLDFVDAGFRANDGKAVYSSIGEIFQGHPSQSDCHLLDEIATKLAKIGEFSAVYIPLGIGRHIDHQLTRLAADKVWVTGQKLYYADMPYALRPWKWHAKHIKQMITSTVSIKWTSRQKRLALQCYATQMPHLLRFGRWYPEIVYHP